MQITKRKTEELRQLTTLQKSWELTMAEIEKHYPDIFICQSEVCIERQKIMNQLVTEALHHINLRRMKDGYNPDKETDSEEERIYRNVMEQHKSLQKENEELTKKIKDLGDKKEKKKTPALSKGWKKS